MEEYFARTGMLLGDRAMERLACSRVAVFGLGGVGGHCAEALARCGIGRSPSSRRWGRRRWT